MAKRLSEATAHLYATAKGSVAVAEHRKAMRATPGYSGAMIGLVDSLENYAQAYKEDFEGNLSDDYYLGAEWLDALRSARRMLSGPLGGLDGGTLDTALCNIARDAGFKDEEFS